MIAMMADRDKDTDANLLILRPAPPAGSEREQYIKQINDLREQLAVSEQFKKFYKFSADRRAALLANVDGRIEGFQRSIRYWMDSSKWWMDVVHKMNEAKEEG